MRSKNTCLGCLNHKSKGRAVAAATLAGVLGAQAGIPLNEIRSRLRLDLISANDMPAWEADGTLPREMAQKPRHVFLLRVVHLLWASNLH